MTESTSSAEHRRPHDASGCCGPKQDPAAAAEKQRELEKKVAKLSGTGGCCG